MIFWEKSRRYHFCYFKFLCYNSLFLTKTINDYGRILKFQFSKVKSALLSLIKLWFMSTIFVKDVFRCFNFWDDLSSEIMPNFWQPTRSVHRIQSFPYGVLGFFCQKPFLFASLFWKRDNPYYHNRRIQLYVPTYLAATSAQSLIQHYIQYRVGYTETKGLERRR